MNILGIETSCDETAAAVVANGREVLSNIIASQIDVHKPFGGVVPEIAARKHIESISYVARQAIAAANVPLSAVAVANGPGLVGALLVGLSFAKSYAFSLGLPLIGVHHIHAHVCANFLHTKHDADSAASSDCKPPFICLVVSGGHTHILEVTDEHSCRVLARTRDDAAGEAFDKVGRRLQLPYPAGVEIDRLAPTGSANIPFPRAVVLDNGAKSLDFSFSGLKSACLQYINKNDASVCDIAASFQQAVVDVLTENTIEACKQSGIKKVALAGGVAANSGLRGQMSKLCAEEGLELYMPAPIYCTDNAAMVASAGYFLQQAGKTSGLELNAWSNMEMPNFF